MSADMSWSLTPDRDCAVVGCPNGGRPQVCPYDGRLHHHGRVHYDCGYPGSRLQFRAGWWLVCDEHYRMLADERRVFENRHRSGCSDPNCRAIGCRP